jgi:hypothetical protein
MSVWIRASTVLTVHAPAEDMSEYRATMQWYWQGKTKGFWKKTLSQRYSVHQKFHMIWHERESGPPTWEAGG